MWLVQSCWTIELPRESEQYEARSAVPYSTFHDISPLIRHNNLEFTRKKWERCGCPHGGGYPGSGEWLTHPFVPRLRLITSSNPLLAVPYATIRVDLSNAFHPHESFHNASPILSDNIIAKSALANYRCGGEELKVCKLFTNSSEGILRIFIG